MIDPILASFSSIGSLFPIARPFQEGAVREPTGKVDSTQVRAQAVADRVEISPEARQAAARAASLLAGASEESPYRSTPPALADAIPAALIDTYA